MARFGYMLLDAADPDVNRQALQLDSIGGFAKIAVDRSPQDAKPHHQPPRQQRARLIARLQPGDVIFAASLDRWCDNLRDFLETWQLISQAGAELCVLAESLDTRSTAGRQAIRILQGFGQLDFSFLSGRKKAGIEAARKQGRRIGRPQVAIPPGFREICRDWAAGLISGPEAARRSGLRNTSFYKKAGELGYKAAPRGKTAGAAAQDQLPGG
jgi:DNA invertase Pin-like site-specific DNA recombinase